jgi:alpha-1,2-mannosyltransferase
MHFHSRSEDLSYSFSGERQLIIGVFSPIINWCGGAEFVALNIINALKEQRHKLILMSNKSLDQSKFKDVFGKNIIVDQQIIFPLRFFSPTNFHNIYTDSIKSLMLKSKCEIVIDVYSNAMLPGVEIEYIHYPLLKAVETGLPHKRANRIFFYPYQSFLRAKRKNISRKLILANSHFTAEAIKSELGVNPHVLYPPISDNFIYARKNLTEKRGARVITVSRISNGKNLSIIPYIAKLTRKEISFAIVGLLDSSKTLNLLTKSIRKLGLSERVKIYINLSRDQLKRMLLTSKVYLHPTLNEHFGISIVEAMALGCIPVVHDSGGPREFVNEKFRYESVEEAAEKVEKAADYWSPDRAVAISNIAEQFSGNTFSKNFISLFNSYFG